MHSTWIWRNTSCRNIKSFEKISDLLVIDWQNSRFFSQLFDKFCTLIFLKQNSDIFQDPMIKFAFCSLLTEFAFICDPLRKFTFFSTIICRYVSAILWRNIHFFRQSFYKICIFPMIIRRNLHFSRPCDEIRILVSILWRKLCFQKSFDKNNVFSQSFNKMSVFFPHFWKVWVFITAFLTNFAFCLRFFEKIQTFSRILQ